MTDHLERNCALTTGHTPHGWVDAERYWCLGVVERSASMDHRAKAEAILDEVAGIRENRSVFMGGSAYYKTSLLLAEAQVHATLSLKNVYTISNNSVALGART